MASYPRPEIWDPLLPGKCEPLLPLEKPTLSGRLPHAPPPRKSLLDRTWIMTTHMFPAAVPRTTTFVPEPVAPAFAGKTPEAKMAYKESVSQTAKTLTEMKLNDLEGRVLKTSEPKDLWCCINRYVKRKRRVGDGQTVKGLTLFFAHANGLPKETWEPALLELLNKHSDFDIAEIWTWESVNHGDSCLINGPNLGGTYNWKDNARDILHFMLHYLPSSAISESPLPPHLERLPDSIAHSRRQFGFSDREFIGIGHSFGGCSLVFAAADCPEVFSSLILIDPILRPTRPDTPRVPAIIVRNITGAVARRAHWSSREEAKKLMQASPFFGAWDPAVLDMYVECGLYDDPNGGVRLKTSGMQEAIVFTEMPSPYEAWFALPKISDRIELKWIMAGKIEPEIRKEKQELVWVRPNNASNVIIPAAGHLITQESPRELAHEVHEYLQRRYGPAKVKL